MRKKIFLCCFFMLFCMVVFAKEPFEKRSYNDTETLTLSFANSMRCIFHIHNYDNGAFYSFKFAKDDETFTKMRLSINNKYICDYNPRYDDASTLLNTLFDSIYEYGGDDFFNCIEETVSMLWAMCEYVNQNY
ncbi:MAG: hypothetical protein J6B32_05195 [Spirochaetaceae bacterium]|nr:hypothetical protein [Spirochaetaceae bacterium]